MLGGSFNPLHLGHAMLADTMVKEYGVDKVLFIPTNIPPHKIINAKVSTQDRLEMLKEFCKTDEHFECEDCEIKRGGISYTVDTLEYLHKKYGENAQLCLLMGQEIASEFHKWKAPERIVDLATLYIVPRTNVCYSKLNNEIKNTPSGHYKGDFNMEFDKDTFEYPCVYLSSSMVQISSTEIRSRIENNQSYRYLVPQKVFEYIREHNLYR